MKQKLMLLVFITVVVIIAGCANKEIDEYAMVSFMIGDVKINSVDAQIGDLIKENDDIVTADNSFCDIKIGDSIIRIKAQTSVKFSTLTRSAGGDNIAIGLTSGKMLCKPKKLLKDESFLVKTPTAVAGVRGTQFAIETDKMKTTRIKVFKGEVRVARRLKQFESNVEKVMELAPTLEKEEKVVITAAEVKGAEKIVEKRMVNAAAGALPSDNVIEQVIQKSEEQIGVDNKHVEKFKPTDFVKENKEIIAVEQKPKEDIVRITRVIRQEKEKPVPDGRILVTRYDIYYIKDGKIKWEGKVINDPVKIDGKLFVAAGEYVFCSDDEGTILWKTGLKNDGSITVDDSKVTVKSGGKVIKLNADTGKRM